MLPQLGPHPTERTVLVNDSPTAMVLLRLVGLKPARPPVRPHSSMYAADGQRQRRPSIHQCKQPECMHACCGVALPRFRSAGETLEGPGIRHASLRPYR